MQRCCYDDSPFTFYGLLPGAPDGGSIVVRGRGDDVINDDEAHKLCCEDSFAYCDLFYDVRPSDTCRSYIPPRRSKLSEGEGEGGGQNMLG